MAVKTDPNNPQGYVNRGGMFELLHESGRAIQDEQKAIAMANTKTDRDKKLRSLGYRNLAGIYLHNNELSKAELNARQAVAACVDDPASLESLSDILVKTDRIGEAISGYTSAKKIYEQRGLLSEAARVNSKSLKLQAK